MGMLKSQIGKLVRGSERQHLPTPATRWKQKAFRIPLFVLLPFTEARGEVVTCTPAMVLDEAGNTLRSLKLRALLLF